jgi:hypothetical protein
MSAVDPPQRSTVQLETRLEFETLISDLSSRFVNLPAAELDSQIEDALRRVCEFLGVDRLQAESWIETRSRAAPYRSTE